MDPDPHLYKMSLRKYGCGKIAMENVERYFWQSRSPNHELPNLADLKKLAKEIRRERVL